MFTLHAGSALTFWRCGFLTSCIRQLKILRIWRKALEVAIPKPNKPLGTQRVIALCLYQRWADCNILRPRSNPEFSNFSPSPTKVQNFVTIWSPSRNKIQKIGKLQLFNKQKLRKFFHYFSPNPVLILTPHGHLLQICNVSSFFIYSLSVEFPVAVVDVSRFAKFEYPFLFRKYFCHAF